ncbi:MAG TPA: adenylate/guanylate cyclase domain-containing protein [Pyrinomonadaceae bacterium]|jgi:class 3 adenylate cyclase
MTQLTVNCDSSNSDSNDAPVARQNTRANLERLLNQMIETPEHRPDLAREIEEVFGQEKAVMILDMSGFSRTTKRHGIVPFLLMIHQMQLVACPCVQEEGGVLVKAEADNLFCVFDTVADAVRASQKITRHLRTANRLLPEDHRLYVAIGVGYGRILNIEDRDLFGDEMNLACKLGEDVGQMGDILLTPAAHAQLGDGQVETREEVVSISGLDLPYYSVQQK